MILKLCQMDYESKWLVMPREDICLAGITSFFEFGAALYSFSVHVSAKEPFSSKVSQFGEIFCTLKSTVIFLLS